MVNIGVSMLSSDIHCIFNTTSIIFVIMITDIVSPACTRLTRHRNRNISSKIGIELNADYSRSVFLGNGCPNPTVASINIYTQKVKLGRDVMLFEDGNCCFWRHKFLNDELLRFFHIIGA